MSTTSPFRHLASLNLNSSAEYLTPSTHVDSRGAFWFAVGKSRDGALELCWLPPDSFAEKHKSRFRISYCLSAVGRVAAFGVAGPLALALRGTPFSPKSEPGPPRWKKSDSQRVTPDVLAGPPLATRSDRTRCHAKMDTSHSRSQQEETEQALPRGTTGFSLGHLSPRQPNVVAHRKVGHSSASKDRPPATKCEPEESPARGVRSYHGNLWPATLPPGSVIPHRSPMSSRKGTSLFSFKSVRWSSLGLLTILFVLMAPLATRGATVVVRNGGKETLMTQTRPACVHAITTCVCITPGPLYHHHPFPPSPTPSPHSPVPHSRSLPSTFAP